jgi:hypothetical protein
LRDGPREVEAAAQLERERVVAHRPGEHLEELRGEAFRVGEPHALRERELGLCGARPQAQRERDAHDVRRVLEVGRDLGVRQLRNLKFKAWGVRVRKSCRV